MEGRMDEGQSHKEEER